MESIKNFHFPNTDFKTVFGQILHPESHGVLRSLRKLVTLQVRLEESQNGEIKYRYKEAVKGEKWKT